MVIQWIIIIQVYGNTVGWRDNPLYYVGSGYETTSSSPVNEWAILTI